jgi:HK97 family phage prohead protease
MRRLCTIEQFSRLQGDEAANVAIMLASTGDAVPDDAGRIISYTFSTPAVARDMHTVAADAWQTESFMRNPVFLWAHDDSSLPIGRVVSIKTAADKLVGAVEYASAELNPFADTVYRMVRAKFLNAVSTSWIPIEGRMSKDRERPGGVDFSAVDLLEISQVPVPAHPDALASARRAGIDTSPIYRWAERLLDTGGMTLMSADELNELRRAAKAPEKSMPKAREIVTRQAVHLKAAGKPAFKRGLYECATLAQILSGLGYCHDTAAWEAEVEGDNSQVPAMIGAALQQLGAALIAMTTEEVAELLAQHDMGTEEGATARAWKAAHKRAAPDAEPSAAPLGRAAGHYARAMEHYADMGKHHEAMAPHVESMRAASATADEQSGKAEEALQRALDNPESADTHIKSAQRCMRAARKSYASVAETGDGLSESHADMGDSHAYMGRSMQRISRYMRAETGEDPEEEESTEGAGEAEPKDAGKKEETEAQKQSVERRRRIALAAKLKVA